MNYINSKRKTKLKDVLYIGSCIKIENSDKLFQIIGINNKKSICWIREWPLNYVSNQTFSLSLNKVKVSTACPKHIRNS